jgi:deoxyadenosine/deoxycytidine kinase
VKAKLPYSFIAVEGNIGAGKTTLVEMLSNQFDRRLILEQFNDNPFLPFFYEHPERYAFPVELFFMTERHKQLQSDLAQTQLFDQDVVADYFFVKTLLFARNNLQDEEYRLFSRLYKVLNSSFPQPDLLVYLHRPVEALRANIVKRGRAYEQQITATYLAEIQKAYLDYFKVHANTPVIILDLGDQDFVANPKIYERIVELMGHEYSAGLHHVSL